MPRVPSTSPTTGNPTPPYFIHTTAFSFVDTHGRQVFLRGVNLSGASKAPVGRPSHVIEGFWETAEAGGESFVGRPLNVDDGSADVHLARLRGWGFNLLRFPVTWEALEHEGPGMYDDEFMDYIVRVLRKCKEYGFKVFMDPHQDVWSRFSGGSGAPFWTLPACGINHHTLTSTQSALLHCEYPTPSSPSPSDFPGMIWSTNYGRLLSQTLFTLFFAGRTFAPKCVINNQNIQDYLQSHFLLAFSRLAERIRDAGDLLDECVIGWDSMNEPFEGLVGWKDLNVVPQGQGSTLKKGSVPTPAQSMRLGMGIPQTCEVWDFGAFGPSKKGSVTIDPKGTILWATKELLGEDANGFNERWGWTRAQSWELGKCVWATHGVWDVESGFILRPDYFRYVPVGGDTSPPPPLSPSSSPTATTTLEPGSEVSFIPDFWTPHFLSYTTLLRSIHPESILFLQPPVFALPPTNIPPSHLAGRCVYSPHYYDGLTLITKHWNWFNADALGVLRGKYSSPVFAVKVGEKAIRRSVREQLGILKADTERLVDPLPTKRAQVDVNGDEEQDTTPAYGYDSQYPTVIGEIGIPYDMDSKRAYGYTENGKFRGNYEKQETALDCSLNAADGSVGVGYTIWTYVPGDVDQGVLGYVEDGEEDDGGGEYEGAEGWEWGDAWNGEDLSLWNVDDQRWSERKYGIGVGDNDDDEGAPATFGADDHNHNQGGDEDQDVDEEDEDTKSQLKPTKDMTVEVLQVSNSTSTSASSASLSTLSSSTQLARAPLGGAVAKPIPRRTQTETQTPTHIRQRDQPPKTKPPSQRQRKKALTPTQRAGYHPSLTPYEFLTFGARAYRAFIRARPLKVVGTVTDFQFDIEGEVEVVDAGKKRKVKGPVFWCTVKVGRGDAPVGEEGEEERVGTEVFLPLVHFGNDKYLGRQPGGVAGLKSSASKTSLMTLANGSAPPFKVSDNDNDNDSGTQQQHLTPVPEDAEDLVDVEVRVSEGTWTVKGQVLTWSYDVPSSSSSTPSPSSSSSGENEKEVKIEVWRRQGTIIRSRVLSARRPGGVSGRGVGGGVGGVGGGGGGGGRRNVASRSRSFRQQERSYDHDDGGGGGGCMKNVWDRMCGLLGGSAGGIWGMHSLGLGGGGYEYEYVPLRSVGEEDGDDEGEEGGY